jgi:hypothetical protein
MRVRLYESAIASRFVISQKISRPATFDFCNSIGHNVLLSAAVSRR